MVFVQGVAVSWFYEMESMESFGDALIIPNAGL
jgi:hypothetical protein